MDISEAGLNLIKYWEQLRLQAYLDGGGVPTIGWGTTIYPNGIRVKMRDICTEDQASEYLLHDVAKTVAALDADITVTISQPMFDALVVFAYNVGTGAFDSSTMLKLINTSQFTLASQQFARWNKDNGKVVPGLVKRRASEQKLFDSGVALLDSSPSTSSDSSQEDGEVPDAPVIISAKRKKK